MVEDAQWTDPSTAEVLKGTARSEMPVLIVCCARPHPLDGRGGWPEPATRLVLGRLTGDPAHAIVEHVLGDDPVSGDLVEGLVERAEGVPLYLEELARNVTAQDRGDRSAVPPSLLDVITARLERLGPACRVARMASVIGREFDPALLRDLCRLEGETLDRHLRSLAEHAVVDRPGDPGAPLRFRHALIHQAAYQSLTAAERARAHSFVADALVGSGASAADPQLAAHHLTAAGRHGEAVAMWRAAARTARRYSRFKEAAGHEREILSLLPYLEDDHRDSIELKARSRLAMCLTAVDQSAPEVLGEALRAQDLARAYGDERTVLDTYLILLPWWQARAEYGSIDAVLPEVRRLTERVGEPAYGYALGMVEASVRIWQGSLADGLRQLGEMFELVGIPLRESLCTLPQVSAPTVLMRSSSRVAAALGFWLTGDARSAWRLVDDALAFATERQVTAARAVVCATAALIAQLDGDPGRASGFASQAESSPEGSATLQWRRWGAALRRWADGHPSEIQVPGPMLGPYFLMLSADDPDRPATEVVGLLDRALTDVRATGERFCEPELLRARARAWLRAGRPEAAGADLLAAGDTARAQLARSLELRVLTDLVALLGDRGARSRLERLVASLGVDGPARSVEKARAALKRS